MAESKSGSFIVNNNTGSFTVSINADQLTEGQKTMSVQIRRDSVRGQVIGNLSAPITINDTSFTPAGTIVSQGCVPGTYTYRVTKANGTGGVYNEDTPNSVSCGYVAPPTYPAAGTVLSEGCVQGTYTYRVTKANGTGGSYNEDTPNSVACGYVAPTGPTYSVVPTVTAINEGGTLTYNITTTGVANGTLLYISNSGTTGYVLGGVSNINYPDGGISVNNNTATFSIVNNITADNTTEGSRTLIINLRTGSTSGPIVATAPAVTINDTSTTPPGAVLKTMNYNTSMGDFATFTESGNFTGWITGIDVVNLQINSAERSAILNNSTIRNGFSSIGLTSSDIDSVINETLNSLNTAISNVVSGNNTFVATAGTQGFFASHNNQGATTVTNNGKIYYRGTLRNLNILYSFDQVVNQNLSNQQIQSAATQFVDALNAQYPLNQSQYTQARNLFISLIELAKEALLGINDRVSLFDFYVKNA